ncbi:MAG TPA: cupin domain-containing protein [Rhizomicrobium sp.]|jgi:hypothetical protein|nr:cupin domain-containing protein [Rhizomicrobium sp.]
MISSLQELLAPLTVDAFSGLLRERTLTFRRGAAAERFVGLLDWQTLRGLLESGVFPAEKLRVTHGGRFLLAPIHLTQGKLNLANFAKLLERGISVVAEPLIPYVPPLAALCGDITARLGEEVTACAIATTGSGGAFEMHFDREDLIILQLEGSKRWKVYGPPAPTPVRGMPEVVPPEPVAPLFDEVLRAGDFLFLPAGYWHLCENGPGLSLHAAIAFRPVVGAHAVKALVPLLYAEEIFRVPLTRFDNPGARAAHEAALKARLIAKIEQMSVAEMLEGRKVKTPADPYNE